jgi:hypothetical protein
LGPESTLKKEKKRAREKEKNMMKIGSLRSAYTLS